MARVLVVDDDLSVADAISRTLNRRGHEAIVVHNGLDAIRAAQNQSPDLVVLDVVMPGMDGGQLFDRIRQILPNMKVLLSSGYTINGQAEKILHRGCNGFIQKPFSLYELSEKIRAVMGSSQK